MKVCIIGPVVTKKKTGGVATFVESLASAFKIKGHQVCVISNFADKCEIENEIPVYDIKSKIKLIYAVNSVKYLKKNPQDLIIGSTWYDIGLVFSRRVPGKKIHYLHGFGVPMDGRMKANAIAINDKLHQNRGLIIANSNFTKMVNEVFYNLNVNAVIPIGISPKFKKIELNSGERKYDLLYVGRIRYNKGVKLLLETVEYMEQNYNQKLNVAIVGDGPQLKELKAMSQHLKSNIAFTGKIDLNQTIDFYRTSKIFISLDYKEPFGQTYMEALLCGCKIICPSSGGQVEYLKNHSDITRFAATRTVEELQEDITYLMSQENTFIETDKIYEKYSYERVADEILIKTGYRTEE